MKTLNLLTLAGVALVAAALNVSAADALTPRAKENQLKAIKGTDASPNLAAPGQNFAATPRSVENRITTVAATGTDADPAICAKHMTATPKEVAECASHPGAAMPCCTVAVTK
jgi:hypothetical protein